MHFKLKKIVVDNMKILRILKFWSSLLHNYLEKFEDTKGVIRSRKLKDRQYNGHKIPKE